MKPVNISRLILIASLVALALLILFSGYTLYQIGWFFNVTVPSLILYAFGAFCIGIGLWNLFVFFTMKPKDPK